MTDQSTLILPLLPLRDIVVFPESLQALFVGRPRSVSALETAIRSSVPGCERRVVLSAQRTARTEEPGAEQVERVIALVADAGGLEYARERAMHFAEAADADLDRLAPSPARESLRASITYVLERRR